jgi:bifunctional non-homologous end joining protein LigD
MQAAIGVMAPFPGFVEPELATSADKLPSGKCRLHQIKFTIAASSFTSATRTNLRPFIASATTGPRASSKIANDAVLINAGSSIIDAEVVVPSADGTTDFCR